MGLHVPTKSDTAIPFSMHVLWTGKRAETARNAPAPDADAFGSRSAIEIYLQDIGRYALITPEEEVALAALIKVGDQRAKEKMIRANLRLVVKIAQEYSSFGLPLLDLIAEGNIGLIKAVERFDPEKGGKLSTYAAWWIKQYIKRALSTQIKTIRLPVHLIERLSKINKTSLALEQALERPATDEEIAAALNLPLKKVTVLKAMAAIPASLESTVSADVDEPLESIIPDEQAQDPAEIFSLKHVYQDLEGFMGHLNEKQAQVIRMRFGFDFYRSLTLEEVGGMMGITRERVRQLQEEALKVLQTCFTESEKSKMTQRD
jgi:RNA polymerase primary sigma factor